MDKTYTERTDAKKEAESSASFLALIFQNIFFLGALFGCLRCFLHKVLLCSFIRAEGIDRLRPHNKTFLLTRRTLRLDAFMSKLNLIYDIFAVEAIKIVLPFAALDKYPLGRKQNYLR